MPPHIRPGEEDLTPQQRNARVLLRSLEELRDSLTDTVDQLTGTIGRLSGHAAERERVLLGRQRIEQGGGETTNVTLNYTEPRRLRPLTFTTPSAISNEVSALSNPITTEQIYSLLDRAAQTPPIFPPSAPAAPAAIAAQAGTSGAPSTSAGPYTGPQSPHQAEPWLTQAQTIEERIQRLSRTARELRVRAATHLGDGPLVQEAGAAGTRHLADRVPRARPMAALGPAPTGSPAPATRDPNAPEARGTTGMGSLLARMRTDQERLETGIRRLAERTQNLNLSSSRGAQQTAGFAPLPGLMVADGVPADPHSPLLPPRLPQDDPRSRRRAIQRLVSEHASESQVEPEAERVHPRDERAHRPLEMPSRSKGMRPTNASRVASQPEPKVVATTAPPSPASTVRPDRSESASREVPQSGPIAEPTNARPTFFTLNQPMPGARDGESSRGASRSSRLGYFVTPRDREESGLDIFTRPVGQQATAAARDAPTGTRVEGDANRGLPSNRQTRGENFAYLAFLDRQQSTPQRQEREEDGMTYRGMTVSSRIRDAATPDPLSLGPPVTTDAERHRRTEERIAAFQGDLMDRRGIPEPEDIPRQAQRMTSDELTNLRLLQEGRRERAERNGERPLTGAARLVQLQMDMRTVRAGPPPSMQAARPAVRPPVTRPADGPHSREVTPQALVDALALQDATVGLEMLPTTVEGYEIFQRERRERFAAAQERLRAREATAARERAAEIVRDADAIRNPGGNVSGTLPRVRDLPWEVVTPSSVDPRLNDEPPLDTTRRAAFRAGVARLTRHFRESGMPSEPSEPSEVDVDEPGGAPTQAVSLAGAREGEGLDRTRRLAIDRGSEESDEEEDVVEYPSWRPDGNVSNEEVEGREGNSGEASPQQDAVGHTTPGDTNAPKESLPVDLHLWPTAGPSTSVADSRVYVTMSDL
ncbi:hypothetical protein IAT38_005980 [Cryptococcus sp. DSM 104549]